MASILWWTDERIGRLATLAAEGRTAAEIARRLGTRTHRPTPKAVQAAARRFGVRLDRRRGDAHARNRLRREANLRRLAVLRSRKWRREHPASSRATGRTRRRRKHGDA
jgi:hypothetical protein